MKKARKQETPPVQEPKVELPAAKVFGFEPSGEPPRAVLAGSKTALLVDALARGSTMEELVAVMSRTGSATPPAAVRSWMSYDIRKLGYGVFFDTATSRYHLALPKGLDAPLPHRESPKKVAVPASTPIPALTVAAEEMPLREAAMTAKRSRAKKAKATK